MIIIPYYETSNFVFSNFSPHAIVINNILFPTVEHAYHYTKFEDEKIKEEILSAKSPLIAWQLAQEHKHLRKNNWNEIKIDILSKLVLEKVRQHDEVKTALLSTGNEEIVEQNPHDEVWGNGKDGNGQNQMGKIWMRIREQINS